MTASPAPAQAASTGARLGLSPRTTIVVGLLVAASAAIALFAPLYDVGSTSPTVWAESASGRWLVLGVALLAFASLSVGAQGRRSVAIALGWLGLLMAIAGATSVGGRLLPSLVAVLIVVMRPRAVRPRTPVGAVAASPRRPGRGAPTAGSADQGDERG